MNETKSAALEVDNKTRYSGIDLLRIIAILLICFSHANQTYRGIADLSALDTFSKAISLGFSPLGTIGNILFVICSSYFLADKTKSRTEKAINILLYSMLISICVLVGFLISGEPLDWRTIIHQILPDIYSTNWFVPSYVVFYLLSPIVVAGLKHLSKTAHFALVISSVIVYGFLSIINLAPVGSYLFQFFYILNLVAFTKWHCSTFCEYKKANIIIAIIGLVLTYTGHFGANLLVKYNDIFGRFDFTNMYAPFLVFALICLFNVFRKMKFSSNFISYLSTCSLFVYLIHENYLLRSKTRVYYYELAIANYGPNISIIYMIVCGAFMFTVGFILAVTYNESFHRLTRKLSFVINNGINKAFIWLCAKLFKQ